CARVTQFIAFREAGGSGGVQLQSPDAFSASLRVGAAHFFAATHALKSTAVTSFASSSKDFTVTRCAGFSFAVPVSDAIVKVPSAKRMRSTAGAAVVPEQFCTGNDGPCGVAVAVGAACRSAVRSGRHAHKMASDPRHAVKILFVGSELICVLGSTTN